MIDNNVNMTDVHAENALPDSAFSDTVFLISQEFERDSRRYNRALYEEQEVSTR